MKKRRLHKRENGAVAIIAVLSMTVFLMLVAFVIDGGLLYYKSAKLQNAVDSAVVAVAQQINAIDTSDEDTAKYYLKENGFDYEKYGEDMKITIQKKGYLADTASPDEYISTGYIKLNVKIKDKSIFGNLSGLESLSLDKSGYAKCDVDYITMPTALRYTIFGGSTKQTDNPKDMTVQINGRASDTLTEITKVFEDAINGINEAIVQPIIGIFGGEPNYGTLVSISLSEAVTNGDIYSNSDINIGVQALNVSRTKDENWAKEGETPVTDAEGNPVVDANGKPEMQPGAELDYESVWDYDDYGQVTYTAVGKINFSNVAGNSTHVYMQNQQYLEQTQVALKILNRLDLSSINNLETLKTKYAEEAAVYIDKYGVTLPSQRQAIIDQKDNLAINADGTFSLNNQSMIVYNVNVDLTNTLLQQLRDGVTTGGQLLQNVQTNSIDDLYAPDGTLVNKGYGDNPSATSYSVQFTKSGTIIDTEVSINQANRSIYDLTRHGKLTQKTVSGYEFAIAKTFKQNSDYVEIPNMKPYFLRQIYKAVANATTSKKDAQAGKVNGKTTVKNAVVDMSNELKTLLIGINKYTQDKQGNDVSAFDDTRYSSDTALTSKDTSPLFTRNYDGTTVTTYNTDDAGHITFNGENIYDTNGVLKDAKPFINAFSIDSYANAIDVFKDANITGRIANDAVINAKSKFKNEKSYNAFKNEVNKTAFNETNKTSSNVEKYDAPNEKDIFLNGDPLFPFYQGVSNIFRDEINVDESEYTEYVGGSSGSEFTEPDVPPTPAYTPPTIPGIPSAKITLWDEEYDAAELVSGTKNLDNFLADIAKDIDWGTTQTGLNGLLQVDKNGNYTTSAGKPSGNYHRVDGDKPSPYRNSGNYDSKTWYNKENTQAYFEGYMKSADKNYAGMIFRENSLLLIGGKDTTNGYALDAKNTIYIDKDSTLVVNGNTNISSSKTDLSLRVGKNDGKDTTKNGPAVAIFNGDLQLKNRLVVTSGSIIFVKGNLSVDSGDKDNAIVIENGGTLIVKGNVSVPTSKNGGIKISSTDTARSNFYVGGKITYAGNSKNGTIGGRTDTTNKYSTITNGTNFVVLNNNDVATETVLNYALHIENGANFYSNGTLRVWNNKDGDAIGEGLVVENGGTARVKNLTNHSGSAYFYVNVYQQGKLYVDGAITCTKIVNNGNIVLSTTEDATVNVSDTITNNGNFFGTTIVGNTLVNNINGLVKTTGNLTVGKITNQGQIRCGGSIIAKTGATDGYFEQNTNDSAFTYAGALEADNIYIKTGKVFIFGNGNVIANILQMGVENSPYSTMLYLAGGDIIVNKLIANDNSTICTHGNLTVNGEADLYDTFIRVGSSISIGTTNNKGNPTIDCSPISTPNIDIAENEKIKIISGTYDTKHINNKGSLLIKGDVTLGSIYNDANGKVVVKGNLTLESYNNGTNDSLTNLGYFYVDGNLTAKHTICNDGGKLYVKGNVTAATDLDKNRVLSLSGDNGEVYVSGYIASDANGEIYIDEHATNTVLSIYGCQPLAGNSSTSIASTVTTFKNNSTDASVYLGTGTTMRGIGTGPTVDLGEQYRNVTFTGTFVNNGQLYVYGNLKLDGADPTMKGKDSSTKPSKTIAAFDINAGGNWFHLDNGHIVKAYGTLTCGGIQLEGYSKMYGVKALEIATTSPNIWDQGLLYYGPDSSVNGKSFTFNCRNDFKGNIYIGKGSQSINVKFINNGTSAATNFDAGTFVSDANVTFSDSFTMSNSSKVYVGGVANLGDKNIKNTSGELYLIDGVTKTGNSNFAINDGCTNFIGPVNAGAVGDNVLGTITTDSNYYLDCGSNSKSYFQNSITISGFLSSGENKYVENRGEAIVLKPNANVHFSGTVDCTGSTGNGVYIAENATFTCNNLGVTSSIYNLGNLFIKTDLTYNNNNKWYSDAANESEMIYGYSIRNGLSKANLNAKMYIGGTAPVTVSGAMQNFGEFYTNAPLTVNGYKVYKGADMYYIFTGEYYKDGGRNVYPRYTRDWGGDSGKNRDYAPHYSIESGVNSKTYFANGVSTIAIILTHKNSELFCDGNLKYGQALLNGGDFIVTGKIEYSDNHYGINHIEVFQNDAGKDTRKGSFSLINGFAPSWKQNEQPQNRDAVMYIGYKQKQADGTYVDLPKEQRTFALGVNSSTESIQSGSLMNWGDMYINAALEINTSYKLAYNAVGFISQQGAKTFIDGSFTSLDGSYITAGSMFMCNGDYNCWLPTKIGILERMHDEDWKTHTTYAYIGGNMNPNANGNDLGASTYGNKSGDLDLYSNTNLYVKGKLDCSKCIVCTKQNVVVAVDGKGVASNDNAFVTKQYDQKGNMSQFNQVIIRGNAKVNGTTKFRDMCKAYIYGNFTSGKFVEIGKALDGKDDTEAKEAPFFINGVDKRTGDKGYDYKYTNAGNFYVKGNFNANGYVRVYAGTTLRVGGKFKTTSYLTLRHDANIYVKETVTANQSVEGGSYSDFFVGGTMKALGIANPVDLNRGTIKIRDCANVFVGGNMVATRYVELGKAGDYNRLIDPADVTEGEDNGEITDNTDGGMGEGSGEEATDTTDNNAVNTSEELLADKSDNANGGVFFIGKSLISYTGYIKEFAFSRAVVGNYVFSPKYITLRHNADLWVMPEAFNNTTYKHIAYVSESDGSIIGDLLDSIREIAHNIKETLTLKTGSIYTMGELTLNRNASLMGTYDCIVLEQCVLRPDTLIYMGHDFKCSAKPVNLSFDTIKGETSVVGFDTYGEVKKNGDVISAFPVTVYANNNINITTTTDMKLTYLIANRGDVKLYDVYSNSNNAAGNDEQLPNAICSFNGNVDYFAMYGKISALYYAPLGTVDLDGYYQDIWGCVIGDKVKINTYYLSMHRFTNWKTMNLQIADSGSTYLISEKEFEEVEENVDEKFLYITSQEDEEKGGAHLFFPGDPGEFYDSIISGTENKEDDVLAPPA